MTREEFEEALRLLGLNREEAAVLTTYNKRSIEKWIYDEQTIPPLVVRVLRFLVVRGISPAEFLAASNKALKPQAAPPKSKPKSKPMADIPLDEVMACWDELNNAAQRILVAQPAQMTSAAEQLDAARTKFRDMISRLAVRMAVPDTERIAQLIFPRLKQIALDDVLDEVIAIRTVADVLEKAFKKL
jgi:hypothetical protein